MSEFKMTVIRQTEDGSIEAKCIDMIQDVCMITKDSKNRTLFHLKDGVWHDISKLSDWEEILHEQGFELTDKTNLVNLNKVKSFDNARDVLFFEEYPTKTSIYASVSIAHKKYRGEFYKKLSHKNAEVIREFKVDTGTNKSLSGLIAKIKRG